MLKNKRLHVSLNTWTVFSIIFVMLIIFPSLNIFFELFNDPSENWAHIKEFMLKEYALNSLILIAFTGVFTTLIGVSLAGLVSLYDFPGRSFFRWALILPLAIPPYIGGYTYHGLLNYTGLIQTYLRNSLNLQVNQKYFDIMSIQGSIFIFTMFLFPYVFVIVKAFLEKQSADLVENARVLGRNALETFLFVLLPLSRAAIVGGVSLVILEVLNDYGVVKYFNVPTFSTAIFKSWFGMGDINSAVRLASILMVLVLSLLIIEKFVRGRKRYSYTTAKIRPLTPFKLKGIRAFLASGYCLVIFGLGFLIPTLQLIYWSYYSYSKVLNEMFFGFMFNSVLVAIIASTLVVVIATIIANYCRISESRFSKVVARITVLGYSIPGAVIAIGVIVFFVALDRNLYWLYQAFDPSLGKLVLTTSISMLIFAYVIRFLAIGFNSVETGFEKVGKKFFEASRLLGMSVTKTFFKVDLKMIKPALVSGFILVFVDILKELPLTLLLRPFNFDTLASKAFEFATDEMIPEAAVPSLIIIIVSTVSIYFFNKIGDREVQ